MSYEYRKAYYKNKYATDEEYRLKILDRALKWREEHKERCLSIQRKYRQKKHFKEYGYLFRAPWEVNIIDNPNKIER
jgi:hypothetical protein